MRRIIASIFAILLVFTVAFHADAATQASSVKIHASVASDSSCQVAATVTLHMEQAQSQLTFPLPATATNITVNGARARTQAGDNVKLVDLSSFGSMVGDFSVTIHYTLPDVVHTNENDQLELQLPLLSGFVYPVQTMEFTVTLPGQVPGKPAFSSGYHQSNIEKDLTSAVNETIISGFSLKALKDHETLQMTLPVSREMFPQTGFVLPDFDALNTAMAVCAVLALVYWLLFLRCLPPRRRHRTIPPDGCTAGELGCVLNLQGSNLTMMIFTWAQLGYLLIHIDKRDRVTLHKRMDMGNERSAFEVRTFQALFGTRTVIGTDSPRFASLWLKTRKHTPGLQAYVKPRSGNPRLFRFLAAGVGLFGGAALALPLSAGAVLQWFLVILMAALGCISCYLMQRWAYELFFLDKRHSITALILAACWLLLDILAGFPAISLWVILSQALAGLLAAFGGRRTEEGRLAMAYTLGLRRYCFSVSRQTLEPIVENEPDYFHSLAPYALALGADRAFARHFGKALMPTCPYLSTGKELQMSATKWSILMRRTVRSMEAGVHQRFWESALNLIRGFIK